MLRVEWLCAADSEYQRAIAAFKAAGATVIYSDDDAKPSDQPQTIATIHFYRGSKDAESESLSHLRRLPHLEDVALEFADFNAAHSKKLLQHVDALSIAKSVYIGIDTESPISDAAVCDFSKIPTLTQLGVVPLEKVDVTDKSLACVKNLQRLRALTLNNTRITDEGLVHLSGMKCLEHLSLAATEISGEGFCRVKDVPLRRLILVETKITDENLEWLSHFDHLELLFLGGCPIDGSGLRHLSRLKELRRLSLAGTKIDDKALLHLRDFSQLEELSLYECAITDLSVPTLRKLKGLKLLAIGKTTQLSDDGRQKLSEALPGLRFE